MSKFANVPEVKMGIVAVSRSCFPVALSAKRKAEVLQKCGKIGLSVQDIETIVEDEKDALAALTELKQKGCNAVVLYLGNFGPEGPETILLQKFDGVAMIAAAAEETGKDLINGRGDAYCGMLNASYNVGIRGLKPYIPSYPVGLPGEIAGMVKKFDDIARVWLGVKV